MDRGGTLGETDKWYNAQNMDVERISLLGEDEVDDVFVQGEVEVLADGSMKPLKGPPLFS
ncbi:MAG: hypothetical protein ACC618_03155 [Patescibacteria group bacterium]